MFHRSGGTLQAEAVQGANGLTSETFEIIALSPAGFPNPRLAHAAVSSGFSGGVALENLASQDAEAIVRQLVRAANPFTITLQCNTVQNAAYLSEVAAMGLERVILVDPGEEYLLPGVTTLRKTA